MDKFQKEIIERLTRVESKIDTLTENLDKLELNFKNNIKRIDCEINSLKDKTIGETASKWQFKTKIIYLCISVIGGIVSYLLTRFMGG